MTNQKEGAERRGFGVLLPLRLSATAARMRSFNAASSTLSPSWMSMARLTFPSRLELNRPEGFCNAAPLAAEVRLLGEAERHVFPVRAEEEDGLAVLRVPRHAIPQGRLERRRVAHDERVGRSPMAR